MQGNTTAQRPILSSSLRPVRLPGDFTPRVYFFKGRRLIKIGTSINLAQRIKSIGEPVELLAFWYGGRRIEQWLHVVLAKDRVRGEWFRPSPAVLHVAKNLARIIKARWRAEAPGICAGAAIGQMQRLRAELAAVSR